MPTDSPLPPRRQGPARRNDQRGLLNRVELEAHAEAFARIDRRRVQAVRGFQHRTDVGTCKSSRHAFSQGGAPGLARGHSARRSGTRVRDDPASTVQCLAQDQGQHVDGVGVTIAM